MGQLSNDVSRTYKTSEGTRAEQPVDASATIYAGSMVGLNAGTGYARQLVAGDAFLGFSNARAANVADPTKPGLTINGTLLGAAGAINVECREDGVIVLLLASVAGATGLANVGQDVYASDGNTFTMTSTSNTKIGRVRNYINGNLEIAFAAQTKPNTGALQPGEVTLPKMDFTGEKRLVAAGKNGAGAITLTGAAVGDRVRMIFGSATGGGTLIVPAANVFEATITVINQIQQASATDLSGNTYIFLLIPATA